MNHFFKKLNSKLNALYTLVRNLNALGIQLIDIKIQNIQHQKEISTLKMLFASTLILNHSQKDFSKNIHKAEFKVFSQWGDDGIIQYIINRLGIQNKTFIEFGVQNYIESNTRFLLMNDNWKGLVLDSGKENINFIKNDEIYWKHDLTAIECFITRHNINEVIQSANFSGEIGLLSIDIDGNDYWIWDEITCVNPILVIIEFNAVFGGERKITIPYSDNFSREKAHFSHLYFGASLSALIELGKQKGYSFVGTNSASVNAYFLRNDCLGDFTVSTAQQAFSSSKFRESRDVSGNLNYLSFSERQNTIKGLPVVNLETNSIEKL